MTFHCEAIFTIHALENVTQSIVRSILDLRKLYLGDLKIQFDTKKVEFMVVFVSATPYEKCKLRNT